MAERVAPEAWVGEPIQLTHHLGGDSARVAATLREVGDRGIVVEVRNGTVVFFPWTAVISITRGEKQRPGVRLGRA